jgi:transmembrane sensor
VRNPRSRQAQLDTIAPRHLRAQAALWVTELHGPERNAQLEAKVRSWIAADPHHAAAFELATEAWQRSGNLSAALPATAWTLAPAGTTARRGTWTRLPRLAFAGAAVLGIVALSLSWYFLGGNTLSTGAAEQRTHILSDGSEVTLDANSRLLVQYDERARQVTLARGEALFTVAKHAGRPFVVVIGDRKVIALGTSFEVRREDSAAFAVTLIGGRVAIAPLSWPNALPPQQSAGLTLLSPGQRLQFSTHGSDRVDSPAIERITAWQHGQLIFEDVALREAAQEFNRVGAARLVIAESVPQDIRVGGVFRIADPMSFARAMANAYPLQVTERGEEIVLTHR